MKILHIPLVIALLVAAGRTLDAGAQTESNLYSFVGSPTDGQNPEYGLVQGTNGYFYGTTVSGGASTNCTGGCGTVFRISPSGVYTSLYSFGKSPTDGQVPEGELAQGTNGDFYGTANNGGTYGGGTIFRISPSGVYTTLYSFGVSPTDGTGPAFKLVLGSDGNFYGTAQTGGTSTNCAGGCGTVFRISPSGIETTLYSFGSSPTDGTSPNGLTQGSDGNFYGTAYGGGTNSQGAVFRISPGGTYTSLYSFVGYPTDGQDPIAELTQGSDGNLYGTTYLGGPFGIGVGTVFRISPGGVYTNLYFFGGSANDGEYPQDELVQGSDGNFYGTASAGGTSPNCTGGCGTIFRISPSGVYTTLYSFVSSPDGDTPVARLMQGIDGIFYGTTYGGGTGNGTVFKFSVPLDFVGSRINKINLAGTNTVITIPSIAGETYQLQYRNSMTSGTWSNLPGRSVTNSIGGLLTFTNAISGSQTQAFYRFAITP